MKSRKRYPDNSEILARKARGRKQLAHLSFAEKLAVLEILRERIEPIAKAREARRDSATRPVET